MGDVRRGLGDIGVMMTFPQEEMFEYLVIVIHIINSLIE